MTTILKPLVDILRALALLLAAAVGLLGLAALGGAFSDRLDVLAHFAPVWLGGGAVAVLLWAVSGRRGRTTPALALVAALASLILMIPELTAAATQKHVKAGGETLTLVQFNLWGRNRDAGATYRWILATDPDIVVIEEGFDRSGGIPRKLARRYPYKTSCAAPRPCSTMILSRRRPVAAGGLATVVSDARLSGAWATFRDRRGPFTVVGVHYTWPYPAGPQQQQTLRLARVLDRFPKGRLIVSGDMNCTPWSFALRRQDRLFGLERRTRALATWPAGRFSRLHLASPAPLLPIDQVYAGKDWRTVSVRRGPKLGSDHYPVVVTLAPAA